MDAPAAATDVPSEQVDAVLRVTRTLVATVVSTMADLDVTLAQMRLLVVVHTRGPVNMRTAAEALGVHPSNATRTCDRLVDAGLLRRRESPTDRRHLDLVLSDRGRQLVEDVLTRRRLAVTEIVERMPEPARRRMARAFTEFADAAGDVPEEDLWSPGGSAAVRFGRLGGGRR